MFKEGTLLRGLMRVGMKTHVTTIPGSQLSLEGNGSHNSIIQEFWPASANNVDEWSDVDLVQMGQGDTEIVWTLLGSLYIELYDVSYKQCINTVDNSYIAVGHQFC